MLYASKKSSQLLFCHMSSVSNSHGWLFHCGLCYAAVIIRDGLTYFPLHFHANLMVSRKYRIVTIQHVLLLIKVLSKLCQWFLLHKQPRQDAITKSRNSINWNCTNVLKTLVCAWRCSLNCSVGTSEICLLTLQKLLISICI